MPITVPKQLQQRGIYFCLVEKQGKKPFQNAWQKQEIEFDNPNLLEHIKTGGNYGVMGGGPKHLVIVDFDNAELQDKVVSKLPKTFTVKTGKGLLHKYFFSDDSGSFKLFDKEMNTLADVQGDGKQVIGGSSIHPNGSIYTVVDESEIAFIPYVELRAILVPYDQNPKKLIEVTEATSETNDFVELVKSKVSMVDILNRLGVNTSKNPTDCLFHDSVGGHCFGFNDDVAHCFHCVSSFNRFSIVKQAKNLSFKDALLWIAEEFHLKKEYDECKQKYFDKLKNAETEPLQRVRQQYLDMLTDDKKNWGAMSELLTNAIKDTFKVYTTKDDTKSEVWVYEDGIYTPNGRSHVKCFLRNLLGEYYNQFIYTKVIEKLEPDTYIDTDEFFNHNYVYEVPVTNGVLNVLTGQLSDFTPDKVFFQKLPLTYDPSAACPQIDAFLNSVFGNEDDVKMFYELTGYCLVKDNSFEKAFMLVGNGRNGKSKLLELLKRFVGNFNVCGVPLSSMVADSFSLCEMFGKLINLAGDISRDDLKETVVFKALTGRDTISVKRKFLRDLHFVNYAKVIFACNELPMVYDFSRGFWDRWILINFPYTFVEQKEYDQSPDKTFLRLRDTDIINKITSDTEMSGLLNTALTALKRLRSNNGFSYALNCESVKSQWIRRSNSFTAFCYDRLEGDPDGVLTKKEVRRAYSQYCHDFNVSSKSDYVIKRVLQDTFGVMEERQGLGADYEHVWAGVKWKNVFTDGKLV
ncbi:MAG: phage/plasmid primase, P4 family [Candidatus Nanoarchaeia archaeon]